MTKLDDAVKNYVETHADSRIQDLCKKSIKSNIKPFYEKQDTKKFMFKGLVINEVEKKARKIDPEAVEYLEDRGLLPFAVSIKSSMDKNFNLEAAKINRTLVLKLYAGGMKFIDSESITQKFNEHFEKFDLERLTNEFKDVFTKEKLAKSKLETSKKELLEIMLDENIKALKCDAGTLKIEEKFDFDIDKIFNFVSGKKEIFLREAPNGSSCEILLLPELKRATLPKTFKLADGLSIQDFLEKEEIPNSLYIKKKEFNKLVKEGFKPVSFEIEIDPMEFFKECPLSLTKIDELYDNGLLDPREFDKLISIDEDKEPSFSFEVLTEGSYGKRREMFDKKLMKRAQNFEYTGKTTNPFDNIQMESFSF